jgi:ADP-heptose:LPS heptosyltransferase
MKIIIRGLNWIGDAVMMLPFLEAVIKKYPNAKITLVVKDWVKGIFKNVSGISEIISYPKNYSDYYKLIKTFRKEKYDIAIAVLKSFSSAFFCFLIGAKKRIGFSAQHRDFLLTDKLYFNDEATSALDTESETLVQEALLNLMHNRTTIVVAHRLSTIVNADKIAVLEDGVIKEIGKHRDLLQNNNIYKKLYDMQIAQ